MAIPPSPIPPADMGRLLNLLEQQAVATLTAAIVIASGKSHSIQQVLDIARDVHFATHPNPSFGVYKEWEKTKGAALNKVHGA